MKRRKHIFIIIALFVIMCIAALAAFILIRSRKTSPARLPDLSEKKYEQFHSNVDMDNDGLDDQVDILQGVKDYINTKPVYKSQYYSGGYPDDGYGVCTDVVAFGLKAAGYDLMNLVSKDIEENPDNYNIDKPDKNIDFRRVRNLKVFFKNHTQSLTLDISDVEEWQGGDIVIFENHIGVVSDRRNKNGVPYVFHHYSAEQKSYEEDILPTWTDVVGHYRWILTE